MFDNRHICMTTQLYPMGTKLRRLNFRPRRPFPPFPPDQARRQGEVANLAFLQLGGRERAKAYLNNYDTDLGGRPLDIALATQEGCWRVQRAIMRMASSRPTD